MSYLVGHGNWKNVVQVENGKYNITEGFVAPACDRFGIVHHGIKQFIRRVVLYATSRPASYEPHVFVCKTLIEIYKNASRLFFLKQIC